MAKPHWDGKRAAPKGQFRVIGEDEFEMPPEEYWVGDYAAFDEAKDAARREAGEMNSVMVYDEAGKAKFLIA